MVFSAQPVLPQLFKSVHMHTWEDSGAIFPLKVCTTTVHAGLRGIPGPWSLKIPQGLRRQIVAQLLFTDVQESLISCLRKISIEK